jgi:hypothetical protein
VSGLARSRLRAPEWIVGAASAALLVDAFSLRWYGSDGAIIRRSSGGSSLFLIPGHWRALDGWGSLPVLRWLLLLTCLLGLAVFWAQAARRAPALPVSLTVLELIAASALLAGLVWRVLFELPSPAVLGVHPSSPVDREGGAYAGLALALALVAGAYASLRRDGAAAPGEAVRIEVLELSSLPAAGGEGGS